MKKIILFILLIHSVFVFSQGKPLVVVDNQISNFLFLHSLDENRIRKITILKKDKAMELWGSQGMAGAIYVDLKKKKHEKSVSEKTLVIINGEVSDFQKLHFLEDDKIENIEIYNSIEEILPTGGIPNKGLILITLKKTK